MLAPTWLFNNASVDIVEWDGKLHTVRVQFRSRFSQYVLMQYCDGMTHEVLIEYFVETLRAKLHQFSWTHYHTGGGSSTHDLPYYHVAGCACKNR